MTQENIEIVEIKTIPASSITQNGCFRKGDFTLSQVLIILSGFFRGRASFALQRIQ